DRSPAEEAAERAEEAAKRAEEAAKRIEKRERPADQFDIDKGGSGGKGGSTD
ncbi:MAG: hypothetical protein JO246_14230, partial [Frankiaceae bacterium]|nr:hypothetical protein [Frankiaceae bacterium]